MVTSSPDFETQAAARILFGPEPLQNENFWRGLDQATIKTAFKKRALETHPDRAKILGKGELLLRYRFQRISEAYERLSWAIQNESQTLQVLPVSESESETVSQPKPDTTACEPEKQKIKSSHSLLLALFTVLASFGFAADLNLEEPAVTSATEIRTLQKEPTPEPQNVQEVISTQVDLANNIFRPGRYKAAKHIRAELVRAIEQAKQQLGGFTDKTVITIIGHADGAPIRQLKQKALINNNQDLSLVRAQYAVQALEKLGISVSSLKAEGAGTSLRNSRSLSIKVEITAKASDSWRIKLSHSLYGLKGVSIQTTPQDEAFTVHFADQIFNRGSARPSAEINASLQKIAEAIQKTERSLSVMVLGYSGKAAPYRNQRLALLRAQAAFLILEETGIPTKDLRAFYATDRDTRSISIEIRPLSPDA